VDGHAIILAYLSKNIDSVMPNSAYIIAMMAAYHRYSCKTIRGNAEKRTLISDLQN
jgi:hypothetical protein